MPAPHHSVFTGRMPFLLPKQQRRSSEGLSLKAKSNTTCFRVNSAYHKIKLKACWNQMIKIQLLITTKCVHVVLCHDILFNIVSCLLFFYIRRIVRSSPYIFIVWEKESNILLYFNRVPCQPEHWWVENTSFWTSAITNFSEPCAVSQRNQFMPFSYSSSF